MKRWANSGVFSAASCNQACSKHGSRAGRGWKRNGWRAFDKSDLWESVVEGKEVEAHAAKTYFIKKACLMAIEASLPVAMVKNLKGVNACRQI